MKCVWVFYYILYVAWIKKKGCIMVYDKAKGVKNPIQKRYNNGRIGELKSSINRAFDNFFNILDCPLTPISDFNLIEPKIEVSENSKEINVSAELPGLKEEDIAVDVSEDGFLTIKGEKKKSMKKNSDGTYFTERSYGMISRTISLPSEIDLSKVSADFSNGVLKINLPKSSVALQKVKRIQIGK